jgi:hypothetical protein
MSAKKTSTKTAKNSSFATVKEGLQYYPSIFPNVWRCLEHIFLTNGNGYDLDSNGNLACARHGRRKPMCITEEGLHWLAYDMMDCEKYAFYPIGSYDYEFKSMGGTRFYSDIYHYPNMNEDWKAAARWFMATILEKDAAFWRVHFSCRSNDPAVSLRSTDAKEATHKALSVRKHLRDFCDRFKIDLSEGGYKWRNEMLAALKGPERR